MGFGPVELTLTSESVPVEGGRAATKGGSATSAEGLQTAALTAGNPESSSNSYSPYREDAATPPPRESADRPEPTTEQLVKRMTTAIERCTGAVNPQFVKQFHKLPEKVRKRFLKAIEQLSEKAGSLE
jgi:hypothetical protein